MNIFYIDVYNVLGHTGTPNDCIGLISKLSQIVDPRRNTIILVLDGPKETNTAAVDRSISSSTTTISSSNNHNTDTDTVSSSLSSSSSLTDHSTPDETTTTTTNIEVLNPYGTLQKITLGTGILADDYILNEIRNMGITTTITTTTSLTSMNIRNIVQVVTADRKLRQQVLAMKPNKIKGVINPVTFWKRYVPRLCGLK
jgi:hypothetical protein